MVENIIERNEESGGIDPGLKIFRECCDRVNAGFDRLDKLRARREFIIDGATVITGGPVLPEDRAEVDKICAELHLDD